jgi:DNA-binding protein HU-beta
MNKSDLIESMASNAGISKAAAGKALDAMMKSITGELMTGGRVSLVGFGSFSVSERAARDGRNPQTGATIKIPARKVVKFKAGSELKDSVN